MEAYDVGAFLGRGGFASVFRAIERSSGRTVALKVVDLGKLSAAGVGEERLRREVALHRSLAHERVVACYDAFETSREDCVRLLDEAAAGEGEGEGDAGDAGGGGERYAVLVLEYCGGGDLRDLVRRLGRVPEGVARGVLRQVCEGLAYLHDRCGVAHRDLKLSNVLLCEPLGPDGRGPVRAKLCDFGVAGDLGGGAERFTLCGTPNYIAPEIVAGVSP